MPQPYDALLLLSFGGPERREDGLPFLENVLRGKRVPQERMLEVAEHYYLFDGISPINEQNRALLTSLIPELTSHGIDLQVGIERRELKQQRGSGKFFTQVGGLEVIE